MIFFNLRNMIFPNCQWHEACFVHWAIPIFFRTEGGGGVEDMVFLSINPRTFANFTPGHCDIDPGHLPILPPDIVILTPDTVGFLSLDKTFDPRTATNTYGQMFSNPGHAELDPWTCRKFLKISNPRTDNILHPPPLLEQKLE